MIASPALVALRAKYLEMKRMRVSHEGGSAEDPTAAMRALAARFPGALREIDELSMSTIDARIAELERAIEGDAPEPWMIALARYHAWLRLALALRREVPDRSMSGARAWLATVIVADEELGAIDEVDDETLGAILRPPAGRLNRVIFLRVAAELDATDEWIESLLRDPSEHALRH
ncbi:MAG: hypothetical protein M3Y87_20595 [Myxococcota bacterium]|nr:hypothetical protein [Myxococcota bacterium]